MNEQPGFFSTMLMRQIRGQFAHVASDPCFGRRIYFENAGGSLTLKSVVKIVARYVALPDNAGRDNAASREIDRVIAAGREDIHTLMGVRSGTIALGESTTANVFKILSPIILNVPGNNVVTTVLDHPSVFDATHILAERSGKQWRVAELSRDTGTVTAESVVRHIDSQTIVLAIIHSSNVLGTTNDVKNIIRQARAVKPNLYVVVDGSQYTPHALVDVADLECDAYLTSSYKTFSKAGASVLYLSKRASRLSHDKLLGKPQTDWELGTREHAGYAAWSKVVEYLCWLGDQFVQTSDRRERIATAMKAIGQHETALTQRMLKGTKRRNGLLDMRGVTVYGPNEDLGTREPAMIFNVMGMTSAQVVSYLGTKRIVVHNRVSDAYSKHTLAALGIDECVRASMCHYNTPNEVDMFLHAIRQVTQ